MRGVGMAMAMVLLVGGSAACGGGDGAGSATTTIPPLVYARNVRQAFTGTYSDAADPLEARIADAASFVERTEIIRPPADRAGAHEDMVEAWEAYEDALAQLSRVCPGTRCVAAGQDAEELREEAVDAVMAATSLSRGELFEDITS